MTAGLTGTKLGKYLVAEEIGQGGMSVVYRATDTSLHRVVAIKVMHAFLAEQPEARRRFHREAVAVARLRHPHIIEIYDYSGENTQTAYIVTELIEGQSLALKLQKGPFDPPEAALLLLRPVASALAHAHQNGVIHRDLKPENILLSHSGAVKLTDFGIARILESETMTTTGTLLGSPAYMAPEYVEGFPTDARADIFSFGAMLYQICTNKLPFEATTPHALLRKIAMGEYPPAQQINPQIHADIAAIIKRCLMRLPEDRYSSAEDLLAEIDWFLRRIGLEPTKDVVCLTQKFDDFGQDLRRVLPDRFLSLGKQALASGDISCAMADFDRVLSLEPNCPEVLAILDGLTRRARLKRYLANAGLVILGTIAVTFIWVYASTNLVQSRPPSLTPKPVTAPLATSDLPPVTEVDRNITFVLRGTGDFYVNGNLIKRSITGYLPLLLNPGEHKVSFVNAVKQTTKNITVPKDGTIPPVDLSLEVQKPSAVVVTPPPQVKNVEFNAASAWVNTFVDDNPLPSAQAVMGVFKVPLAFGKHRLKFVNPHFQPHEIEINVNETDPPQRVVIHLEPLPAKLYLLGVPDGAVVEVAGKQSAITELTRNDPIFVPLTLAPGQSSQNHEVAVKMAGRADFRTQLVFRPGEEQRLNLGD